MATFLTGTTFGATEQVTNTKLHNIVNNASISNIQASEFASNLLNSLPSSAGRVPSFNVWNIVTVATNSSIPNVAVGTHFRLYSASLMTIATFANAPLGEFTLIAQQASWPVLIDTGNLKLNGNWVPAKSGDNIKLLWDGTSFIELGRTLT